MNSNDPTRQSAERHAAGAGDATDRSDPAGLADWLAAARLDAAQRSAPAWIEAHLVTRFEEKHALSSLGTTQQELRASQDAVGMPARTPARMPVLGSAAARTAPGAARGARRWAWFGWWLAAPSFTLIAIAVGLIVLAPAHIRPDPAQVADGGSIQRARFIALAPLDVIAADSGPRLVTARIPRAAVAGFGLPIDPARADQPLNAEFLVSARGAVLGVRFLD